MKDEEKEVCQQDENTTDTENKEDVKPKDAEDPKESGNVLAYLESPLSPSCMC